MEFSSGAAATPQPLRPVIVPPRIVQPRRPPRAVWAIPGAALAIFAAYAVTIRHKPASAADAALVPTVAVSTGDVAETVRLSGTVQAEKSVTLLAPRIQGSRSDLNRGGPGGPGPGGGLDFNLVLLRLAKPGTMVKAGDVVGEFDTQNQLQRLDDYRDTVVQLEASIGKMTADLAAAKEAQVQAVRSAKADWDKALLDIKTAKVRSEIDAEKNRLTAEEGELTYKEQVAETAALEESQMAALRSAQFNLAQARSELQRAEKNIERMTVRAPIAGMVVLANLVQNNEMRQVREGDQIFAGQPFLSIVDPRAMVLKANVNQVDAERLRLGMKAMVTLDAYPDLRAPATLVGIGAMAVTSTFRASYVGEIPVRFEIQAADPRLIPDLTGSAEVTLAVEKDTTVAPRAAIFADAGGAYVFVKTPEGWERRHVDLGLSSFTDVAVHSGLHRGDVVALGRAL